MQIVVTPCTCHRPAVSGTGEVSNLHVVRIQVFQSRPGGRLHLRWDSL